MAPSYTESHGGVRRREVAGAGVAVCLLLWLPLDSIPWPGGCFMLAAAPQVHPLIP